jgi:hypothetical protein
MIAMVALLAFAAGALFIAACGGDDDNGASAQVEQEQFDALREQVTKTSVLAAMTVFRVEELHQLDEDVSAASEIDSSWEGRVTRMKRATAGVDWPSDMREMADTLLDKLTALETALKNEDLDAAKTLAPEAHDAWHDLEHDAYPFIAGESHGEEGDGGHSEGENDSSASPSGH